MAWSAGLLPHLLESGRKRGDKYVQEDDPNFDDYFINNSNFESNQELPY